MRRGCNILHSCERQLRFVAITVIERLSQLAGIIVSIIMAVRGFGYWALIASGDNRSGNSYSLRMVNRVLDPGPSATRGRHQVDATLRWDGHLEWFGRVRRL